jgi:protein TonB
MRDGYTFVKNQSFEQTGPTQRFAALDGPLAVLSIAPARRVWFFVSTLAWAAAHSLFLAFLLGGAPLRPAPTDQPTFEMIMVADDPQPEPAQEVSPVVPLMAAVGPAEPVTLPDVTPPAPEPAMGRPAAEASTTPTADPAPAPAAPQASVPEPPNASSQAAMADDRVPPPPTLVPTATTKLVRPSTSRRVVPRRDTFAQEALMVAQPEVRPAAQRGVAAITARPAGTAQTDQRAEDSLRGRIREAVQAAVRCPAAARMMGLSGKAGVAFDYRDGAVIGGVQLSRSTGTPMLDAAALAAVRDAHYPNAPPEVANHLLRLLVWIEEACST